MAGRKYLEALRNDLTTRRIGRTGSLPTLRDMAKHYSCSLSSIRQAVEVLKSEGLLYTVSGKGTFAGAEPPPDPASRRRMIGAVTLRHVNFEMVETLKAEWQRRGWLIANYNSWDDQQRPELERDFLEQACRQEFAGVILCGSPLEPLNTDFYAEMRRRGLKVAHNSPYRSDMSQEAFFLCDYRAGGRLGVTTALSRQCTQVVLLVNQVSAPYMTEMQAGVVETAAGMQIPLLPTLCCRNWTADWHESSELHLRKRQEIQTLLPRIAALPPRTALLCCGADMAGVAREVLNESGLLATKQFFILSLNNGSCHAEQEGGIYFDFEAVTRAAMEYVCDDSIHALQLVQRYFAPVVKQPHPMPVPV